MKKNRKGLVHDRGNVLYIRFQSVDKLPGGTRLDELRGWQGRRGFLRKPQYNYGWDWSSPLPSIGLTSAVYIENDLSYKLVNQSIRTFKPRRIDFEVSPVTRKAGYHIDVNVEGHGAKIVQTIRCDTYKSFISLLIPDPQLWFPNGYGKSNPYNYSVALVVGDKVVDSRKRRLGLREVETRERPFSSEAGPGFPFEILVNGETICCKGPNCIPCEIWLATVTDEQYDFYLGKTKKFNFNMLRGWGGGIYEKNRFYELCDELGIMVWHDFMFAGPAGFPVDILRDEIIKKTDITDCNATFFDAANNFSGCITGIREVLRRQGLLEGIWTLNENKTLSSGQKGEIGCVSRTYPKLNVDAFVAENIDQWLA